MFSPRKVRFFRCDEARGGETSSGGDDGALFIRAVEFVKRGGGGDSAREILPPAMQSAGCQDDITSGSDSVVPTLAKRAKVGLPGSP